jgi:hypothetical protein
MIIMKMQDNYRTTLHRTNSNMYRNTYCMTDHEITKFFRFQSCFIIDNSVASPGLVKQYNVALHTFSLDLTSKSDSPLR